MAGLERTISIRVSSAVQHSIDHKKGVSFFRRRVRGQAMLAKLGMKGC